MGKPITWTEKLFDGYALIDLAYRDYIAARFLLNNQFIIQGLTLASTAVEKYLKAIIAFTCKEKEKYSFHLDNIEKLKKILLKNHHDVTQKFDPVFLDILVKVYKIRYYDQIKRPFTIGFFLNQFIGELDATIYSLETSLSHENDLTSYRQAVRNNDPYLYENNFILNKQDKKEFMEKLDTGFLIDIYISSVVHTNKIARGENISNKYQGRIAVFTDQPDWLIP